MAKTKDVSTAWEPIRGGIYFLPPSSFKIAVKGHFLHDPTSRSWYEENRVLSILGVTPEDAKKGEVDKAPLPPLRVWKDGDELWVVTGRERVIDTIEANVRRKASKKGEIWLPYVLVDGDEQELRDLIDIENTHRKVLSPLDIAQKIKWRREAMTAADEEQGIAASRAYDDEHIAYVLNLTRNRKPVKGKAATDLLDGYLRILECPACVRDAISDGSVPWTTAEKFAGMDPGTAKAVLGKLIESGLRGKAARKAVDRVKKGESPEDAVAPQPKDTRPLEDQVKDGRTLPAATLRKLRDAFKVAVVKKPSSQLRVAEACFEMACGNKDAFDELPELALVVKYAGSKRETDTAEE